MSWLKTLEKNRQFDNPEEKIAHRIPVLQAYLRSLNVTATMIHEGIPYTRSTHWIVVLKPKNDMNYRLMNRAWESLYSKYFPNGTEQPGTGKATE